MQKEVWKSRWGLLFATLGAAIGLGNIWRFPKEVAANGGGAFIIAYVIFLFSWSVPLLIAEFSLGKHTRLGTIGAFRVFAGKKYAVMGAWMMVVSTIVCFYYAVVTGWTIRYFIVASSGNLTPTTNTVELWQNFITSPLEIIFFQFIAIALCAYVVYKGIRKGIEIVNKILIPLLFVLLGIAAVWALSIPGAFNGLKFMYIPRWEYLGRAETWVRGLAQSAWSCSAGFGMAITYAVYMKKKEDTTLNAFITGLGDTAAALIAGIAVICTVFAVSASTTDALGIMKAGETGLAFVHLTNLFIRMPGGILIAAVFFLATAFAALTSLISGFEIAARNFMDHGWSRHKSIGIVACATFLLGLPSAVIVAGTEPVFLANQDFVWGLGLIVAGFFVAFAVWKYGVSKFRKEIINTGFNDIYIGRWWDFVIVVLFPLQFGALMFWYLWQSLQSPQWWNPLVPIGFATLILQWCIVMLILLKLNKWLVSKELKPV
ncbi:MAG: sodium-dependent transporter [Candidatus Thermoplasmatota archaeon]